MKNILHYNGYWAKATFDSDSMVFHGKVEGIRDLVTFESDCAATIEDEFHKAVDDYILLCNEIGKEPSL